MSIQPQQQQPVVDYPNTVSGQGPPASDHSHSNGSFGVVFIVLAVILVISGIACCLGRLCKRSQVGNKHTKPNTQSQQNPNFRLKERAERGRERERERGRERDGDLEFGFDKGFPVGRPAGNGDHVRGHMQPYEVHDGTQHMNGHMKGESHTVDDGQFKPGP